MADRCQCGLRILALGFLGRVQHSGAEKQQQVAKTVQMHCAQASDRVTGGSIANKEYGGMPITDAGYRNTLTWLPPWCEAAWQCIGHVLQKSLYGETNDAPLMLLMMVQW